MSKHLPIPGREPTPEQSSDNRVQLGEPMDFIRDIYRNGGEGFLTGAENDRCTTSMGVSL